MSTVISNTQCRSCGSAKITPVLDLGLQPLANSLLKSSADIPAEKKYPLRLAVCESCWLMQITDLLPPVDLFGEYLYLSSYSPALLQHAREASLRYIDEFSLGKDSLVVEIASNDGYLLKNFREAGIPHLGVEPAANIAKIASEQGITTVNEFFDTKLATKVANEQRHADLILGNNVFAHAPNTNDFVAGIKTLLQSNGTAILEFPYGVDMLDHTEFDTIYHEHVFYFTLTALEPLFERHGLRIRHVERLAIHGGSLRIFVGHADACRAHDTVVEMRETENARGVTSLAFYSEFQRNVEEIKSSLCSLLGRLKQDGHRIAAYGASAKGSTLLNYFGLDETTLDFVVDRSAHKQGLLTPGSHIPILATEHLLAKFPAYTVLLTWNFAEEILSQQSAYLEKGGHFIVPVPSVRIVP